MQEKIKKNRLFSLIVIAYVTISGFGIESSVHAKNIDLLTVQDHPSSPPSQLLLPSLGNENKQIDLSDYKGQITLIHFFASWCPYCIEEHSKVIEVSKISDLKIIGVSIRDKSEKLQKWLDDTGNPYIAVALDEEAKTAKTWGVMGTPTTFLLNSEGEIIYKTTGKMAPEIIKKKIESLKFTKKL